MLQGQRELLYRAANTQLTAEATVTEDVDEEAVIRGALLKMMGAMTLSIPTKGICTVVESKFPTGLLEGVLSTAAHSMADQADHSDVEEPEGL
jgi:hypothetical protein